MLSLSYVAVLHTLMQVVVAGPFSLPLSLSPPDTICAPLAPLFSPLTSHRFFFHDPKLNVMKAKRHAHSRARARTHTHFQHEQNLKPYQRLKTHRLAAASEAAASEVTVVLALVQFALMQWS